MTKKLNDAIVAKDIADEFLLRLGNILAGVGDGIDEQSISRFELGWKASAAEMSIQFDIVAGTECPSFVIRELDIKNISGLPGKVYRLIAEFSDRYLMDVRNEALKMQEETAEISKSFLHFLKNDIGFVLDESGQQLIRHPQH